MLFKQIIFTAALAQAILAAPIRRQLAGEGSACNSIFTSTDNGVGYGIENAEDNIAGMSSSTKGTRQLHGEGEACDSVLTQTDNGVGYGVENAEGKIAQNIGGLTGNSVSSSGGGSSTGGTQPAPAPAPAPGPGKGPKGRQLDKIANGFGEIGQGTGITSTTSGPVTQLDNLDGTLTSDAANAGASLGSSEESTLENLGSSLKRQLDKVAAGAAAIGQKEGVNTVTGPVATSLESLDGTLTDGAANLGAGVADAEESTLEGAGNGIPVIF